MKALLILLFSFCLSNLYAQSFLPHTLDASHAAVLPETQKNPGTFKVSHSSSLAIFPGFLPLCLDEPYHYENSYYLAYDLKNDFNLNGDWIVENIEFAIEHAEAENPQGQPLIVKLHVMSEYNHKTIIRDSLTLIAADTVIIEDTDSGTLKNITPPGVNIVADGKVLVVEFLIPNGMETHNLLFLGANNLRYSDSTYIRAARCDIVEPVNVSQILFPESMLIANIYGQYASPKPEIQSFTVPGQVVNTEIVNEPDYTVKLVMPFDASLQALTPEITIPLGFKISPEIGETIDFSQGPVVYTVDNNFDKVSQSWEVSIVNAGPDIIGANLAQINGEVVIKGAPYFTLAIPVKKGTDLSNLAPDIMVYEGFSTNPASGSVQDFSSGPVTYTVSNGESLSQDWAVSVFETTLGVDARSAPKIKLFPNPASKYIQIQCQNFKEAEIFDAYGKRLINAATNRIDISALSPGLYIVRTRAGNKNFTDKFFVVR